MSHINEYLQTEYHNITIFKQTDEKTVKLVKHLQTNDVAVMKILKGKWHNELYYTLKNLNHPSIVKILDVITDESSLVVIEEYISGNTLYDELEKSKSSKTPLNENEILSWILQISNALQFLHNQSPPIIYRDIKPSNIMLVRGQVVLTDFDISRAVKADATKDTIHFLTSDYAPPEQYGFGQTDARSDIYSLGIIFRECLKYLPNKIDRWNYIINKCTALDPLQRYQTVQEVIDALKSNEQLPFDNIKDYLAKIHQCKNKINDLVNSFSDNMFEVPISSPYVSFYLSYEDQVSDKEYFFESTARSEGEEEFNLFYQDLKDKYISCRNELVQTYMEYLPQYGGKTKITAVAEKILYEAQKVANNILCEIGCSNLSNINITVRSIPRAISSNHSELFSTGTTGIKYGDKVKNPNQYCRYISIEEKPNYAERPIFNFLKKNTYEYDIIECLSKLKKDADRAIESESSTMQAASQREVNNYKEPVFVEMNQIKNQIIAVLDENYRKLSEKIK